MKNWAVILLMILPLTTVMAQQRGMRDEGRGQRDGRGLERMIPDLTDDQKSQIKDLHLGMMKESLDIRNQLGENRARMRTLQTAEEPDMKAIEKLIDESSALQAELKKKQAANHQEVRKLLTEEQRVIFDSRASKMRERAHREGARARHRDGSGKRAPQGGAE